MPFIKRIVEPQYLSNRPLPPGCDRELDTVSNYTLCGLVRQLADLSLRAHDIFSDINAESHVLAHKAVSLRRRITRLEEVVEILDARSVKVPESTLEQFKNTTNHYKASHKIDQDLFVQRTRPGCLQAIYDGASTDLKVT
ncbi:actin-binding protein WASF1-like [Diadema setosum]|uniref:actin-binding protein WASF1-like n=1 Tax=Diadema setosum TaxID=31175 RepID=UPI003B3B91EE